jgi:transcriptional regulator with XRE-family HTH domain
MTMTMTAKPEGALEHRVPTPADMAGITKALREANKWTQETLAELAGITERTIQRIEGGEPSSLDTRRAIARAFKLDDLDVFEKPWPFPNVEKLKLYQAEIERTTVVVRLTRIRQGRTLRTMIEGAESSATEEIGELSNGAREAFASIVDYLRDYNDVRDEYSASRRLEVDQDIDSLLQTISDERAAIGAGLRHARLRSKADADQAPMDWTNIYLVLAPNDALPSNVRVPRAVRFG